MSDIKTHETQRNIKVLDKAAVASERIRTVGSHAKNTVGNLLDDGQVSPEEYASEKIRYSAEAAGVEAKHAASKTNKKLKEKIKKRIEESEKEKSEPEPTNKKPDQSPGKQTSDKAKPQQEPEVEQKTNYNQRSLRRQTTRQSEETSKNIRRSDRRTIKTKDVAKTSEKSRRTIKSAEASSKRAIKTAQQTEHAAKKAAVKSAKAAEKAAKEAAKAAAKAEKAAKETARKAAEAAKAAAEATAKAIKAIIAAIKELIAAIAEGGWVAVVIIVVICLVALIVCSVFGIFFSGEDTGTGMTMRDAVVQINQEYNSKVESLKSAYVYDEYEIQGSRAPWKEVLAVYAVKTTGDPDNAQEVASMDAEKAEILSTIYWNMNEVSGATETRTVTVETTDETSTESTTITTETVLVITITHKTAQEMAEVYHFNEQENEYLSELLSDEYASMWNAVMYGVAQGNGEIVAVAQAQLGNTGETYWSYMGYESRVEWCACFVSWCANECGYVNSGVLFNTAGCSTGVSFFTSRDLWQDNTYVPNPGDIIFFDWDDEGGQNGEPNHVGIVEKVENGYVYTIEGNSGDRVSENAWAIGYYEILGYGTPLYE